MPCQRVSTTGRYLFGSVLNRMVAPAARLRLTLLSSSIFPVIQVPAGTVTRPPLAAAQAAIALAEAAVLSGPPDRAPKLVIGKSRAGKVGGTIRPRMAGTWSHGSAGGAAAGPAAGPRPAAGPTMAASAAVPVAPASSAPPALCSSAGWVQCWTAVLTENSANDTCTAFAGPHDRSWPPKKVEKKTPENGIALMPVTLVVKTWRPSYQTVTRCAVRSTSCSTLCHRPSAANDHLPRPRSLPKPLPVGE